MIIFAVVVALAAAAVFFAQGRHENRNTTANTVTSDGAVPGDTRPWKEFSDPQLGIAFEYPPDWRVSEDKLSFPGSDVVITNDQAINRCGCALFITRESNPRRLSIDAWLQSQEPKKGAYGSRDTVAAPRNASSPFAGEYQESDTTFGGFPARREQYGTEGGGGDRLLILHDDQIYVITRWSDGYYFTDAKRRGQLDNGALYRVTQAIVDSLRFL